MSRWRQHEPSSGALLGVVAAADVTLIDSMLALSPEERLRQNDRMIRTIEELRHGFAAARAHDAARQAGGERD
jgi:hypothetical protein